MADQKSRTPITPLTLKWPPPLTPTTSTRSTLRYPPNPDLLSEADHPLTARGASSLTASPTNRDGRAKSPESRPKFRDKKPNPSNLR
ncbi:hypothetical protein ACFX2A_024175 [Malus domestica]